MLSYLLLLATIAVPLAPMGYRLYFKSQVDCTIDRLRLDDYPTSGAFQIPSNDDIDDLLGNPQDLSHLPGDTVVNSVKSGERGFDELVTTIETHKTIDGEIVAVHLIWGEILEIVEVVSIPIPPGGYAILNGMLCAEMSDGTYSLIEFNALDSESTAHLNGIKAWARETATIESYVITISFVVLWFIIAILEQGVF